MLIVLDVDFIILVSSTGFWHDSNCGSEYKFICKRRDSLWANTTVAPTQPPQGGCPDQWKKLNSKVRHSFNNEC